MRTILMPTRFAIFVGSCIAAAALQAAAPMAADAFQAGSPVTDNNPYPVKIAAPMRAQTTLTGATIVQSAVYQSALASNGLRKGCAIQNRSDTSMRVFIGAPTAATDDTAFDLPAGGIFSCTSGSMVITDQISIAGNLAGAPYTVARQ